MQDTINVQELRIGDNDTLSAQVAVLVQADWLFLLTDVDFLYTANPSLDPSASPIYVRFHASAVLAVWTLLKESLVFWQYNIRLTTLQFWMPTSHCSSPAHAAACRQRLRSAGLSDGLGLGPSSCDPALKWLQ